MAEGISMAELERLLNEHGLDFGKDSDYQFFQEAYSTYPADPEKNIRLVVERAADLKKGIKPKVVKFMDEYFRHFRKQINDQAKVDQVKPQLKSNADMTATESR